MTFLNLEMEEKRKISCNFKEGVFWEHREGSRLMGESGVKDHSKALCLPKIVPSLTHEWENRCDYDFLCPFKPEIEVFQRRVVKRVLIPSSSSSPSASNCRRTTLSPFSGPEAITKEKETALPNHP